MPKIVSNERVAVRIEGDPHTIYIKPMMDYGTRNRINGTATRVVGRQGQEATAEFDVGAYQIALLVHNVVGWSGPELDDLECTPENIERLDPNDPLLERVLEEIGERNARKAAATDPNLPPSESQSGSTRKPAKSQSQRDQ